MRGGGEKTPYLRPQIAPLALMPPKTSIAIFLRLFGALVGLAVPVLKDLEDGEGGVV